MASIRGIELKGVRTFRGVEWPVNYQGNVYYQGKKLGFWSQDSWGGPDRYEFDTSELDAIAKDYYKGEQYFDLDCLLGEILTLQDREKIYKKAVKDEYVSILVMTDGYLEQIIKFRTETDKDKILKSCEKYIKDFEAQSHQKDKMETIVYTSLADFVQ